MIWTVAKKELRGYFNSAVALIFLGAFLAGALYTFFWYEKFFARGLADLRPLFEWMPKLLIILVSALSMRLWAEEKSAGTLEILLTLPVPRWKLVAGKFTAGMLLIAIALALTLGIPLTVAHMGNLDIGPVIGGYLAALLLSAAYLVIGMCVSAATNIQIVAFVGTAVICLATYLIGGLGDIGRIFGTGVRFESVARGVLDLRDLAYYAGIVALGFAVNVALLGRVSWGQSAPARKRRFETLLAVGLIAANALVLDVWIAPVRRARIDLTQDGAYSLSGATKDLVSGLDEKLLIRGYFSEKTHPDLAPLIPQLHDLLDEYRVAGNGKIDVEFVDPTDDDEAKRAAKDQFDIVPSPVAFATASERSVVNAYFAIAIRYGNQHEVIKLQDLIAVRQLDINKTEIGLGNVEYLVTKAIKKTMSGFSSVESMFASGGPVKLSVYVTPDTLPDNLKALPDRIKKITDPLVKQAAGKLTVETVSPSKPDDMLALFNKYGLRPYQDLLTGRTYYFAFIVEPADHPPIRIQPPETITDEQLKTAITDGLKRAIPGALKTIAMYQPPAPQVPEGMGMPQQGPPQTFQKLRQSLSDNYNITELQTGTRIPDDVDAVLLCGPTNLDAPTVQAIDQFVMRGGSLIVLAGRFRLAPSETSIAVENVSTGLEKLFETYGITVGNTMVLDSKSDTFPIPRARDVGGGMIVREIQQLPYPYFVRVDGAQMTTSIITGGIPGSIMHFVSPLEAKDKVGEDTHELETILESSAKSWLSNSTQVDPDPEKGFPEPPEDARSNHPLAITVTGGFTSFLKGQDPKDQKDPKVKIIEHSPKDTRIVVFGSSVFATDALMNHAEQFEQDLALANINLVHNAVDWAVADTDLLAIRARTAGSHSLTLDPDARDKWPFINVVIALFLLLGVVGFAWMRRLRVLPVIGKGAP